MDPGAGSRWSAPGIVAGFATSPPNAVLMRFAESEGRRLVRPRVLDLGCGAGRNAMPLARLGFDVVGLDLSWAMLRAAHGRAVVEGVADRLHLALAPMDELPARDGSFDLVIAQGIWNLARSAAEFRRALAEAARVARPGAGLFVFAFSRSTFPADAEPVPGEPFVFTQFAGEPQCFLTEGQLLEELDAVGFTLEPGRGLTEYNRPRPGALLRGGPPAIYEGTFRHRA